MFPVEYIIIALIVLRNRNPNELEYQRAPRRRRLLDKKAPTLTLDVTYARRKAKSGARDPPAKRFRDTLDQRENYFPLVTYNTRKKK